MTAPEPAAAPVEAPARPVDTAGHYWLTDAAARARRLRSRCAREVLALVAAEPAGLTAAEVATRSQVSRSYIKDILDAARAADMVTATPAPIAGHKGRPPLRYRTTPPIL